jgi:transcriptional regulator with XRE-family HTH domain
MKSNFKTLGKSEMQMVSGGEIRKYRDNLCYTQEFMASKLGIGQSAYQKIESGNVKISIEKLIQIASILNKPLEAFLDGEKNNVHSDEQFINVNQREWLLTQKFVLQQEKRIEELEAKLKRRDNKIELLKQQLGA